MPNEIYRLNLYEIQKTHHALMRQRVKYEMGAKVKLNAPVSSVKKIDCSGLVRYLVYRATNNKLTIPDGSWNQREWLMKQSANPDSFIQRFDSYDIVQTKPNGLYLCVLNPVGRKSGHIWFVNDGFTMESRGGVGPDERVWNVPVLRKEVDFIFCWDHIWIEN